jgi:hypothetical protein
MLNFVINAVSVPDPELHSGQVYGSGSVLKCQGSGTLIAVNKKVTYKSKIDFAVSGATDHKASCTIGRSKNRKDVGKVLR